MFFTVIGYNTRIFLNDRESAGGVLTLTLGNSLSFAPAFQRHKQEMAQVICKINRIKLCLCDSTGGVRPGSFQGWSPFDFDFNSAL